MYGTASRITQGTLASDLQVEGGNKSVTINGIIANNTSAVNVEITFTDKGDADLFSLTVLAESMVIMDIPFLAENGIQADSLNSSIKVTFFHGQVGA